MKRAIPAFLLLAVSGILVYAFWFPSHAPRTAMLSYMIPAPQAKDMPKAADKGKEPEIPLRPIPQAPMTTEAKPSLTDIIDRWLTLAGKASPVVTAILAVMQFRRRKERGK